MKDGSSPFMDPFEWTLGSPFNLDRATRLRLRTDCVVLLTRSRDRACNRLTSRHEYCPGSAQKTLIHSMGTCGPKMSAVMAPSCRRAATAVTDTCSQRLITHLLEPASNAAEESNRHSAAYSYFHEYSYIPCSTGRTRTAMRRAASAGLGVSH